MQWAAIAALVTLALAGGPAPAGEARPVSAELDQAVYAPLAMGTADRDARDQAKGLTHPKAHIIRFDIGGVNLALAMDAADPDAPLPDRFLLVEGDDLDFRDARELKAETFIESEQFVGIKLLPVELSPMIEGREVKLHLAGIAQLDRKWKQGMAAFQAVSAVEARCDLGGKALAVRVIDGNLNHRYGDPPTGPTRTSPFAQGDTILVAGDTGAFTNPARKVFVGQPIFVNGQWFRIDVDPNGTRIDARPAEVVAGRLHLPHGQWSLIARRGNSFVHLGGGNSPRPLPAGEYSVQLFRQRLGDPNDGGPAWLLARAAGRPGDGGKALSVEAGATSKLALGTPITGRLEVRPGRGREGQTLISLTQVKTAGGLMVAALARSPSSIWERIDPPQVVITDAEDIQVHKADLEYG